MPTLAENRFWDSYSWPSDGDEWTDQAEFSAVPYQTWKQDIVETFIFPNIRDTSTVLELAVGHGRWTPYLASRAKLYIGVDFSPTCISYCRKRFSGLAHAGFYLTDGRFLSFLSDSSVHFVWSYDSFVHIEPDLTESYLAEIARILAPGGRCSIHHPGTPTRTQRTNGGRSDVSRPLFARLASAQGLRVLSQVDKWGPSDRSNTKLFADCVSTITKPIDSLAGDFPETVRVNGASQGGKIEMF
jgi:ubiquinone/menaquinone biosynthesis C-methylase UbiE